MKLLVLAAAIAIASLTGSAAVAHHLHGQHGYHFHDPFHQDPQPRGRRYHRRDHHGSTCTRKN